MNSSGKSLTGKTGTLNPHAVAFVPSSSRSTPEKNEKTSISKKDVSESSGRPYLDRSGSNISNSSDDEVRQYWRHQLPDDITPDFKSVREEESLSLAGLSINDGLHSFEHPLEEGNQYDISSLENGQIELSDRLVYSGLSDEYSSNSNMWNTQFINGSHLLSNGREGSHYCGDPSVGFFSDPLNEQTPLENAAELDPLMFLASQFPGFAADSLAEVYYANGGDLNLTIEMLTQLELQVDGINNYDQSTIPKAMDLSTPNFDAMDFPALSASDSLDGSSRYGHKSASFSESIGDESFPYLKASAPDFASAVRRLASQDSGHWKLETNDSLALPGLRVRQGRSDFQETMPPVSPAWLETGDAVAQLYSEWREEARDFARLRNTCFEQARQAFIIGNKALAKELSLKGQLYNMQMKEAHEKARDAIYRHRNRGAGEKGKQPLIDLHGLHVNEAVNVLKHELGALRRVARAGGQRLQVMVCVGTGHHTKGSRTPARLPAAVHRHLTQEGLPFSEDQPGLLRVLIR
ncbi:polyadenylate-binding protein-interacting protein 7-like [Wolffia australiana]